MRNKSYNLQELMRILRRTVVGQEEYLKKIALTVWLHNQRLEALRHSPNLRLQKHNLLCVGPTGSGKTLAITTVANLFGLDVLVEDMSGFTGSGWKGREVTELIKNLYIQCEQDVARTERGIIVMDEIDKMLLYGVGNVKDSFCAENAILKIIEGTTVDVADNQRIDTTNILFVAAGAFEGIEDFIRSRVNTKTIGFHVHKEDKYITKKEDLLPLVTREDLVAYGAGHQFLGRFANLAVLRYLTEDDLTMILLDSDSSVVKNLNATLRKSIGVSVKIDMAGAEAVAKQAIKEGTGARGLAQIIIPVIDEILFIIDDDLDTNEILLTAGEDGEPWAKLLEGPRYNTKVVHKPLQEEFSLPRKREADVEHFCWKLLTPHLDEYPKPLTQAQAMHYLLCSVVYYVLKSSNDKNHTFCSIYMLAYEAIYDKTTFDLLLDDLKQIRHSEEVFFYYKLFKESGIPRSDIPLVEALELFGNINRLKYEKVQKKRQCTFSNK